MHEALERIQRKRRESTLFSVALTACVTLTIIGLVIMFRGLFLIALALLSAGWVGWVALAPERK